MHRSFSLSVSGDVQQLTGSSFLAFLLELERNIVERMRNVSAYRKPRTRRQPRALGVALSTERPVQASVHALTINQSPAPGPPSIH